MIATLCAPIIPSTAKGIATRLGLRGELRWADLGWETLQPGTHVTVGDVLFPKPAD